MAYFGGDVVDEQFDAAVAEDVQLFDAAKVGRLLYEIEEKKVLCDGTIEWTGIQFYEHILFIREEARQCCFPQKYHAEAIPRFKIVNVTFSNGGRSQWRWVLSQLLVGIFLIVIGALVGCTETDTYTGSSTDRNCGAMAGLLTAGCILLLVSPLPLFLNKKFRYVTIDVKGKGGGRWFSMARTYTFRFSKVKPDEAFILQYVFEPLRKGVGQLHSLAHINEASLAYPLASQLSTNMREVWSDVALNEEEIESTIDAPLQNKKAHPEIHRPDVTASVRPVNIIASPPGPSSMIDPDMDQSDDAAAYPAMMPIRSSDYDT